MMDLDELRAAVDEFMGRDDYRAARELMLSHEAATRASSELSWNMGWAAFKLDDLDDACKWLEHAIEIAPADAAARWALGHVYMARKNVDKAEREWLRSIALRDSSKTRNALGFLYHAEGKVEQAKAVYLEGLRIRPDDPSRCEVYADFLADTGFVAEAKEYYERADALRAGKQN